MGAELHARSGASAPFTALNGGPLFVINPSISLFVKVETVEETARLFSALADGGAALIRRDHTSHA